MSISFNGTDSKLQLASGISGLSFPISIFCWVKPNSAAVNQMVCGFGVNSGTEELMLYAEGSGSGKMRAFQTGGGASSAANSTTSLSTAWTPALAVFTSAASRTIYYGAGAAVTETTDTAPANLSSLNKIALGMRTKNESLWFAGDLAEFAVWSGGTALGAAEWASLQGGAVPNTVSSGTLWDYWELRTDASTQTGVNGRVLTKTNTSQGATHPIGTGGAFSAGATLAAVVASGSLTTTASGVTSAATLGAVVAAGSLGATAGTITSEPLRTNNGTLLASVALDYVDVYLEASGVFVGRFTGLSTNGSGVFTVTSSLLTPGTAYKLDWRATGGQRRMPMATAA